MKNTISMGDVANEFSIDLLFAIKEKYNISIDQTFEIFDKTHYWNVINDDTVCCTVAHDGVDCVIQRMQEEIDEILSRYK